jgi:hypothetical protein
VTFQISRAVLTLAVRLIDRLAVDPGTRGTSPLVVRVDVIDMDDEASVGHIDGTWRIELMLCGDAVEPNGCISRADFAMDRPTLGGSMDAARHEPECLNQEVVRSRDVLIRQNRDDSLER